MCRYWDDPAVLEKLSKAMGDAFDMEALTGQMGAAAVGQHEEEEGEEEDDDDDGVQDDLHGAASSGAVCPMALLMDVHGLGR